MATKTARLIRGPPPSPPQSNDGDQVSEVPPEVCGIFHPLYEAHSPFGGPGMRAPTEGSELSFDERGSHPAYGPTSDYPHGLPLPQTMIPNGLQVNTPPASDNSIAPSSLDSVTRWSSPSSQKHTPGKTRVARSPRVRRRARKGKDREARPQLPGPLSELTRHMTHVPVKDMEVWVHRSVIVRHQEVAKKNGKVARPMNSFMLYRSAYADRAKEWFAQNNHQVVSEAAGDSWKLEPREVKEKYELLANIEKHNHLKAHPGYKFTPAKDKKKKPGSEDSRSLLDEQEGTPDSSPALLHTNTFSSSDVDSSGWDSSHSTPFDLIDHGLPTEGYIGTSWPTSNPSRPVSGMIPSSQPTQYLQPSSGHGFAGYGAGDAHLKVELQEMSYTSSSALAGLPGAAHHDLLQPQTHVSTSESCQNGQLDPQLLDTGSQIYGSSPYSMWQESPTTNCYLPVTTSLAHSNTLPFNSGPSFQHMADSREAWDSSPEANLGAGAGEFDRWINSQQTGY